MERPIIIILLCAKSFTWSFHVEFLTYCTVCQIDSYDAGLEEEIKTTKADVRPASVKPIESYLSTFT